MRSGNSADNVNDSNTFRLYEYCALFRVILLTSVVEVLVLSCYFKLCAVCDRNNVDCFLLPILLNCVKLLEFTTYHKHLPASVF